MYSVCVVDDIFHNMSSEYDKYDSVCVVDVFVIKMAEVGYICVVLCSRVCL